ncbi:LysE family translocator [soil metagenome]
MTADTLLLYTLASLALAVIPGPTMLLALSNGIAGGMKRAAWGIAGASLGSSALIAIVALGLGSLLSASEWLFNAIRVAGVVYLVWLGVKLWRSEVLDLRTTLAGSQATARSIPQQGRIALLRSLAVALSNPKTVLFFAAFLPQFVDITRPQGPQYLVLGAIFVMLDTGVMLAYAGAGSQAVRWLSRRSLKALNHGCAIGMWLLAATLAAWRRPT